MIINPKDVRVDTYLNSGPLIKMAITHTPTGIRVSGEGSSSEFLKRKLMAQLGSHVFEHTRPAVGEYYVDGTLD